MPGFGDEAVVFAGVLSALLQARVAAVSVTINKDVVFIGAVSGEFNVNDTLPSRLFQQPYMTLTRMDNVGIVVESLDAAISFFTELGMTLEGRATIEGEWAGRVTGLGDQHVEIAMMVTPDGHSRLELSRFIRPSVVADHRNAPVNALGYLRVMFAVTDIDDTLARLRKLGAELVGEVVQYEQAYRLCYIRGPEGILIGLAEELKKKT